MQNKTLGQLKKYVLVNDIPLNGIDIKLVCDKRDVSLLNDCIKDDMILTSFETDMHLIFLPSEKILHISGNIRANIDTVCSVSLEPMVVDIDETIDIDYSQKVYEYKGTDETYLLPEKIENGRIDVYDIALQTLQLCLPNHPVLVGARIDTLQYTKKVIDFIDEKPKNPFDVLKNLIGE